MQMLHLDQLKLYMIIFYKNSLINLIILACIAVFLACAAYMLPLLVHNLLHIISYILRHYLQCQGIGQIRICQTMNLYILLC